MLGQIKIRFFIECRSHRKGEVKTLMGMSLLSCHEKLSISAELGVHVLCREYAPWILQASIQLIQHAPNRVIGIYNGYAGRLS